ncbi:MAG: hypothetical protein KKB29_01500, partial [Nanoarchaeota archaeon]|nr:hypothetical protein [Nanoarchaeota archaeon]
MDYKRRIDSCRSCDSRDLSGILSLGDLYVTNFVDSEAEQGPKIPLDLVLCDS